MTYVHVLLGALLALGGACVGSAPPGAAQTPSANQASSAGEAPSATQASPARIEVERDSSALVLRAVYESSVPPAGELSYQLDARKHGASGTSTTRQGGAFTPEPSRADTLSVVRLGVQPGDSVAVDLAILSGEDTVATAHYAEILR